MSDAISDISGGPYFDEDLPKYGDINMENDQSGSKGVDGVSDISGGPNPNVDEEKEPELNKIDLIQQAEEAQKELETFEPREKFGVRLEVPSPTVLLEMRAQRNRIHRNEIDLGEDASSYRPEEPKWIDRFSPHIRICFWLVLTVMVFMIIIGLFTFILVMIFTGASEQGQIPADFQNGTEVLTTLDSWNFLGNGTVAMETDNGTVAIEAGNDTANTTVYLVGNGDEDLLGQ